MPSMEKADWKPEEKIKPSSHLSISHTNLLKMKVGECMQIIHDDLACKFVKINGHSINSYMCSLLSFINAESRKKPKRIFKHYHIKEHVAIIKRLQ